MGLRRLIKNYIYRKKFSAPKNLIVKKIENNNILITGANSGIGLELTKN
jgi:FlaA1/EpsC-like NDP-sugar epimerase